MQEQNQVSSVGGQGQEIAAEPSRKVELLLGFFFARVDKFAVFADWGKPAVGMLHPEDGGTLRDVVEAHILGKRKHPSPNVCISTQHAVITKSRAFRIGAYSLSEDNTVRVLCADFDGGVDHANALYDPLATALAYIANLNALSIEGYLEQSGGGSGWHVWTFFEEPVPAWMARRLGLHCAPTGAPLAPRPGEAGSTRAADAAKNIGIEIFPKQERLSRNGVGNMVWLPWFHDAKVGANEFYRVVGGALGHAYVPESFDALSAARLKSILSNLGIAVPPQAPAKRAAAMNRRHLSGAATHLSDVDSAVRQYNADRPRQFPASGGDCPICGHRGCFGRLPQSPDRWSCFSASHGECGVGIAGNGCFHGDALDIDAAEAGRSRVDHLKATGYTSTNTTKPPAQLRVLVSPPSPGAASASVPSTIVPAATVSASLAAPVVSTASPMPPATLAGLMVQEILTDEPIVKLMLQDPAYAVDVYATFVASALKEVTLHAPAERTDARAAFIFTFTPTPLAGRLDALFDVAPESAISYGVIESAGAPESVCLGEYATPAYRALHVAWRVLNGGFHASYGSLVRILRRDARVSGGEIAFNEMAGGVTVNRVVLSDTDVSRVREQVEAFYNPRGHKPAMTFGVDDVHRALEQVGAERTFHPVREYLSGLPPWDGVARLDEVADLILHAVEEVGPHPVLPDKVQILEKNRLARVMLRKFTIGAVARAMKPGCKNDVALILKGGQSFLKSTFFKTLFGDQWFIDTTFDIHNPQAAIIFRAAWCVEWAELETMSRARDKEVIKAFLSSSTDTFRPPYGKRSVRYPRHTIFVGTTNKLEFLADETGSRRFWVLDIAERIDIAHTAEWRDQLWAEALVAFNAGETWHLSDDDDKLREKLNKEYARTDPWTESIAIYVDRELKDPTSPWVTPESVMLDLGIPKERWSRRERERVCEVLKTLGLGSVARTVKGKQSRVWARISPTAAAKAP